MAEVHCIALLYPKPDKVQRVQELLQGLSKTVHEKEPDTLRYLMTTEMGSESPTIVMMETYKDKTANAEHLKTPYFRDVLKHTVQDDLLVKDTQMLMTSSTGGYDRDRKLL